MGIPQGSILSPALFSIKIYSTKAELCGVDSPLDKLAVGVKVGPNMATVVEKQQHTSTTTPSK